MSFHHFDTHQSRLTALWLLRTYSTSYARRCFSERLSYADHDITEFPGLPGLSGSKQLGIVPAADEHHGMVNSMECLAPCDFAAAARRIGFRTH